jgi:hypothetical protein
MFLKNKTPTNQNCAERHLEEATCVEMNNSTEVIPNIAGTNTEESAILSVVGKIRQDTFQKRKQHMLDKILQVGNTVENEEQLEAVLKQVAPLESIINALSKKDIPLPKTLQEPSNKKIETQKRFSSTKKKNKGKQKKYSNPLNTEKTVLALEMMGNWQQSNT